MDTIDQHTRDMLMVMERLGTSLHRARHECGECEEACPQKLPIPVLLKEVSSEMEGRFFNTKLWLFSKLMKIQRWKTLRSADK